MTNRLYADDARCNGTDCPRRDTCLRYLCRKSHEYAVFAVFDPNNCNEYLEANTDERIGKTD
jgi:hypothetical protein